MTAPDPALLRALTAARAKREERGATGDGRVVVQALAPEEALALDGLIAPRKPLLPGTDLRIALSSFEAALSAVGIHPTAAYEQLGGPLRDLPAERAAAREQRRDFRAWLREHAVALARPGIAAWLEAAPTRVGSSRRAARWLHARWRSSMPCRPSHPASARFSPPRSSTATRTPSTSTGRCTRSSWHCSRPRDSWATPRPARSGRPTASSWTRWSSTVACLNLTPVGDGRLARLLALMHGSHVVLTFGQLASESLAWPGGIACHSCENPSVLIAAERELGSRCPPLICTAGYPSDAVRLLLASLHAAGALLRHHGDGDAAGEQILGDLRTRYGAQRWGVHRPGVPEELVIDDLVADLRRTS